MSQVSKLRGRRRLAGLVPIVVMGVSLAVAGHALGQLEYLPPRVTVPVYKPVHNPFYPGEKLVYVGTWLGIPAATATLEIKAEGQKPQEWTAEGVLKSSKLVDVLFKMRDYMREDFDARTLMARQVYIRQHENKRLNEYEIDFDRGAELVRSIKRNSKGVVESHEFRAENPVGPISGSLLALSQPIKEGQTGVFDVFTSTSRYVLQFTVVRREKIRLALGDFDAFRITPQLLYLNKENIRKKAHEVTVWVSADERHLPLRVTAATFIGSVRVDLTQVIDNRAAQSAAKRERSQPAPEQP